MCAVHGCNNEKLFTPKLKWAHEQHVCRRHYFAMKSGRVGRNWRRDIHNFHRKNACEYCGVTAYECGAEVFKFAGMPLPRVRDVIKRGMEVLHGDHIDGRAFPEANFPENIQTLCPNCHRFKTLAMGDCKRRKSK